MFKKWNINDTPEITIPEMNENLDKIEEQAVNLENLIKNGDFSDGTNGWGAYGTSAINAENNVMVIEKNGTSYALVSNLPNKLNLNDIYYFCALVSYNDINGMQLSIGNGARTIIPIINTDVFISVLGKRGKREEFEVFSPANDILGTTRLKSATGLNLTQTFGAGNEPSKEVCDTIMEVVGWFDGKTTLSQTQLFTIIFKLIEANAFNSIMTLPNFDETE